MKLRTVAETIEIQDSMSDIERLCIRYVNSMQKDNITAVSKYKGLITGRLIGKGWNFNSVKFFIGDLLNIHTEKDLIQLFSQYSLLDD